MKIYGWTESMEGFMEIEPSLRAEQKFVGGLIDVVGLTNEIDLVCNDEGFILGLEPRVAIVDGKQIETIICGNCFACRHHEDEFIDIKEDDLETIHKYIIKLDGYAGLMELLADGYELAG